MCLYFCFTGTHRAERYLAHQVMLKRYVLWYIYPIVYITFIFFKYLFTNDINSCLLEKHILIENIYIKVYVKASNAIENHGEKKRVKIRFSGHQFEIQN